MFCPNCGAEVAEGANFCPQCGHQVGRPPAPAEVPEPSKGAAPEAEPAKAVSKLDEGGWARLVMSCGLLGLLFVAFTYFGWPSHLVARVGFGLGAPWMDSGYDAAKPVLGILFAGVMLALGFIFREKVKGLLTDRQLTLVGGGVALAAVLMLISGGMGPVGRFIFQVLIAAVLGGVGFVLLQLSPVFSRNLLEKIALKVVPVALFIFAAFTALSGIGTLAGLGFLEYSLPNVFLIIASIGGLLGVLGFVGATVLHLLGVRI